jgi:hypothetical protein
MYPTNKLLEVKPLVDISIIRETLTRIGIVDKKQKKIYQSCHLIEQFDTFYLAHFKQLFVMSRSKNGFPGFGNVSMEDIDRRNSIAFLLAKWNMIKIIKPEEIDPHNTRVDVISHKDAGEYAKIRKFNINNLNYN